MTGTSTRERILDALGRAQWPTANELSKDVGLHPGTVRSWLSRMAADGLVERVRDADVTGPRGDGADRWNRLAQPLPAAEPSDDVLCDDCARIGYGDWTRHQAALTPAARERLERLWQRYVDEPEFRIACDRCGGRVA